MGPHSDLGAKITLIQQTCSYVLVCVNSTLSTKYLVGYVLNIEAVMGPHSYFAIN